MMRIMRTTVTLDADTEALVHRLMAERGLTFKRALNQAIRDGAVAQAAPRRFKTKTYAMGPATISLDKALAIAGSLEDDELVRRLSTGR